MFAAGSLPCALAGVGLAALFAPWERVRALRGIAHTARDTLLLLAVVAVLLGCEVGMVLTGLSGPLQMLILRLMGLVIFAVMPIASSVVTYRRLRMAEAAAAAGTSQPPDQAAPAP
jgi:hypothetical protein